MFGITLRLRTRIAKSTGGFVYIVYEVFLREGEGGEFGHVMMCKGPVAKSRSNEQLEN